MAASNVHMRAIIFLANESQDSTEVATPWKCLSGAGFDVQFATGNGDVASADQKLLTAGLFGRVLVYLSLLRAMVCWR